MSEEVYTVEHAAERLKLHPKTVLRFIRDGRLRAARVGKSYRILRSDLDALAGLPLRTETPAGVARVTSIVDVPGIDPELARRLAIRITSARMGSTAHPDPMSLDVAYDPETRRLKVVIVGSPADTAAMLRILPILLEGGS